MTDIAVYQPAVQQWVTLLEPAAELAKQIANTDFVPEVLRNKPAAITAAILYGSEIGIGPMQALAKVDIVKGRPAPRAELARALALAAGHDIWVEESTNTRVKVSGKRKNSEHVMSVTWTLDDVKKAGIVNQAYQKYPRAMLLARASAELVRQMAPDVLGGIGMFAEEADGDLDAPAGETTTAPAKATTRKRAASPAPALPAAPIDMPPLPDDEIVVGPTEAQIKKMMACFNDVGIKERDDRLRFIGAAARTVDSSKDLTVAEAAKVIDALEQVASGALVLDANDWTLAPGELVPPEVA